MNDRIVTIIPARLASSRFPGKPLAPLLGRPVIEHVWRRAVLCAGIAETCVATCDHEIREVVEGFGGQVIMTSPLHERASDRVAEAAEQLSADIVVMVQGDEPLITPEMILTALAPMLDDCAIDCANLIRRLHDGSEYLDRNTVKVVMNGNYDALYFSRSPIPLIDSSQLDIFPVYKQVCVIPFRRQFLAEFARLEPTPLECAESIDMLRALEHGRRVRLAETQARTHAVDTPEDLQLVEVLMEQGMQTPMNS